MIEVSIGVAVFLILASCFWFGLPTKSLRKKKVEVEEVEELETVNRPLTDFRGPSEREEELKIRVNRLENAIVLIEQAFGWVLIPEDGKDEIVTVIERIESGHIEYVPAILVETEEKKAEQPQKPIRPRFVH